MRNRSLKTTSHNTTARAAFVLAAALVTLLLAVAFSRPVSAETESVSTNTVLHNLEYDVADGEVSASFDIYVTDSASDQGRYLRRVRFHNFEEARDCPLDTRNYYDGEAEARRGEPGRYDVKFDDKYEKLCIFVELKQANQQTFYQDFHDLVVGMEIPESQDVTQVGRAADGASQQGESSGVLAPGRQSQSATTCDDLSDPNSCQALQTIDTLLNFLALLVMPVATIMIVIGGIQYSMAGDNSESIKNARAKIFKAVLALIGFIGLWSFLKWLIPGGLE